MGIEINNTIITFKPFISKREVSRKPKLKAYKTRYVPVLIYRAAYWQLDIEVC